MNNSAVINKKTDAITKWIFIVIQTVLFVLVFTTHNELHKVACFGCVVNPFVYSLKFLSKDKIAIYTQIALLTTVFADLFLVVITPQFKDVAMTFFAITQICYALRLLQLTKHKAVNVVLRVVYIIAVIVVTFLVLKDKTDYLSVISMFYYANLILNLVYAIAFIKKSPLFAVGLLLFLLCDTIIGLDVASGTYLNIQSQFIQNILDLPFNLAWVFYVPSQALLALSLHKAK